MNNHSASRRQFLRASAGLALAAGPAARSAMPFAMSLAGLGAASDSMASSIDGSYRALVCVFLNGGNDSHNWLVPTDADNFREYTNVRRELAWGSGRIQPITCTSQGSGRTFGLPQELAPLRNWYEAGQAAFVANVGTLVQPTTRADYQNGRYLPVNLFSHNDQASTWQSLSPEGARSGWGGRMGDMLMASNGAPVFTAVSATGNAVFLSGSQVTQYQVSEDGPVAATGLNAKSVLGSSNASAALGRILAANGSTAFQSEYSRVLQRSISASSLLKDALASTNVAPIPATSIKLGDGPTITLNNDSLARQLRVIAQMISCGPSLGMRRQVFMVWMNGFDSHVNQMRDQPSLMTRVALSIDYFLNVMKSAGMLNNVTLFTASDFGRTLVSNGSGSDHGWGSHHFVAGGAVKGRNIYGQMPITALGTETDIGSGRMIPSTSVSQYAATMGSWMGLGASELNTVLPGLSRFNPTGLGFL